MKSASEGKNKGGRPSKLNEKYLAAMRRVIGERNGKKINTRVLALTDEELWEDINFELEPEDQAHLRTWQAWKRGEQQSKTDDEICKEFHVLIKRALGDMKQNLLRSLLAGGDPFWARLAWTLERKFKEWNKLNLNRLGEDPDAPLTSLADALKGLKTNKKK